ncbi:hypothetical protein ORN12_21730 [Pantoea vagans]|uniref:hypothetical protein n=1 Tax=Pantoea vagans TaxID=470934 RepID=UPI002252BBE5|nr:hypothetical protein [Pantoea vagans]MCX3311562.1 hypothetical protein [Pantoea vagans]
MTAARFSTAPLQTVPVKSDFTYPCLLIGDAPGAPGAAGSNGDGGKGYKADKEIQQQWE